MDGICARKNIKKTASRGLFIARFFGVRFAN
jgi:hypothetical protein